MAVMIPYPQEIPPMTRQVGDKIVTETSICHFLGHQLAELFREEDFADLYAGGGRPAFSPVLLAVVTILQFWEDLPDRKASEQVVMRMDWKYALRQELTWKGFHFSDLCYFRERLLEHEASERVFEKVLAYLVSKGFLKKRGNQRTDSTHVLGYVARLSRTELKWESVRMALTDLLSVAWMWTVEALGEQFVETYSQSRPQYRMSKEKLTELDKQVAADGMRLLEAVEQFGLAGWRDLPHVQVLVQVLRQQVTCLPAAVWEAWKPPETGRIESPHEPEARFSQKRETWWVGYKTHLTETVDEGKPDLITDVRVTTAEQHDNPVLEAIQHQLIARDLCPKRHYVDEGYMSAEHIERSASLGIDLRGRVQTDRGNKPVGFRLQDFVVDMDRGIARCPAGKQSTHWSETQTTDNVSFRAFFGTQCRTCSFFTRDACTTYPSGRRLDINRSHDTLQARRKLQDTQAFRKEMYRRNGIEGTISEAVRAYDLRHARYRGLKKMHFQSVWIATAVNLHRFNAVRQAA